MTMDFLYVPVLAAGLWLLYRGWRCWCLARDSCCDTGQFAQYYAAFVIGIGAAQVVLSVVMVLTGLGNGSHIARFWAGYDIAVSMALLLPLNHFNTQLAGQQG